jgi:uncharacterized protein (TIGR03790 family)
MRLRVFIFMILSCWAADLLGADLRFKRVADEAARVVIVANSNDPESVELARFYADERMIPRANIVALDLPVGEEISWDQYTQQLLAPLQRWLIEEQWIEAIQMDLFDDIGRQKISTAGHRISYLVTCRGVPLKIRADPNLPTDAPRGASNNLRTNRAAVDSELTLINRSDTRRDGLIANPVFGKTELGLFDGDDVVRVSRLDGPTFPAARRLVTSALEAERNGLIGRAMVDLGGPHAKGDEWFEEAVKILLEHEWKPQIDRERSTLKLTDRADSLAIYLGWYAGNINGPFRPSNYEFAPGAIALHLHSYSAGSLRLQDGGGWTGPLVARGVAATVGNVYEPYMEFTHHPHRFIAALLAGATLGEAGFYAMPVLSWQSILVGDPLYRPMNVSYHEQLEKIDELPPRVAAYLALRNLDRPTNQEELITAEQIANASGAFRKFPNLALAWKAAQLEASTGEVSAAAARLGIAGFLSRVRADEWGLMAQIAVQLREWGDLSSAFKVWAVLLEQPVNDAARKAWLPEAIETARSDGQFSKLSDWERDLRELTPPDSAAKK